MQTSDTISRNKKATWQAVHSLLHLLTLLGTAPPKPQLLTNILSAAAADAHTIPSDALLALFGSLRSASVFARSILTHSCVGPMFLHCLRHVTFSGNIGKMRLLCNTAGKSAFAFACADSSACCATPWAGCFEYCIH